MEILKNIYPIFEANQTLTHEHLNNLFTYLDEQERLTRVSLIGIGIACGLEIQYLQANSEIHLSKGCGVTSQGYLIVEPEDVVLTSYRALPKSLDYSLFEDKSTNPNQQYPLWELFPAGEPNTVPLGTPLNFLSDKAVLLFLELKEESLRNCSASECDDKGSKVTATIRRLLIKLADLKKILATANQLDPGLTFSDLEAALTAQLNLPDLRRPRYNVPNTTLATSNEVLAAFLTVFRNGELVQQTQAALDKAYEAFKPIVQGAYPLNPFPDFSAKFGFLDDAPTTTTQVRFLPYYYDFFDDLLKAYNEFHQKGVALLCACCPPESLFPRHLMLGVLFPDSVTNPDIYRHHFLAAAVNGCEQHTKEVVHLFQRIVEMIVSFSDFPQLPEPADVLDTDNQIRITPSQLGDVPLSNKAIPYYYRQNDTPPLYHFWNFEKMRQNRANHNLSYRSDEYIPIAPTFVTDALSYDLEPYDFLRIEGHLGKNVNAALKTLLTLKDRYRLPIEIIALRTGAFDETIEVDLSKETCRFQDLEALYDTLREELLTTLCEGVKNFYSVSIPDPTFSLAAGTAQLPLLQKCASNYQYQENTVGAWYEKYLAQIQLIPYIDVNQNKIDNIEFLKVYCSLFADTVRPPSQYYAYIVSIYYFTKLAEILPSSLDKLGYAEFENKYQDLIGFIRYFRSDAKKNIPNNLESFIPQEDLIDQFDQVLFACKLEPIREIHEEYVRRIREIKKRRFLSFFLQKNPGVQHKAGVPLGGTFIIVYHEDPKPKLTGVQPGIFDSIITNTPIYDSTRTYTSAFSAALNRISANPTLVADPNVRFLIGTFTGYIPNLSIVPPVGGNEAIDKIIEKGVNEFADGTVIADFYLPYLYCSECASVQYVLPTPPLGLAVDLDCTSPNGTAEATLTPQGGMPPFTYQLDNQPFKELKGKLLLVTGPHTLVIRDSAGSESAVQSLTVPEPLTIEPETYDDNVSEQTYIVSFRISGGTAPYTIDPVDHGTVKNSTFTSIPVDSGQLINVTIKDNVGCSVSKTFQHTVCNLPCEGNSRRCAYRLWLQPPVGQLQYKGYKQMSAIRFRFNGEDITFEVPQIDVNHLNNNFQKAIGEAINYLNEAVSSALKERYGDELGGNRLVLSYEPNSDSDPFGILWIEYFTCDKFTIEFDFTVTKVATASYSLTMRYTNEGITSTNAHFNGTVLRNNEPQPKSVWVPAFDCSERNQCDGTNYEKTCQGSTLEPQIEFSVLQAEEMIQFIGKVTDPHPENLTWVWDFPESTMVEPYVDTKVKVRNPGGFVMLTVITEEGCFEFVYKNIELR
jgi:hypothetical protein